MLWRAARRLRSSNRVSSPLSEIPLPLIIRANEMSHSCRNSLLAEVESNGMESCKVSKSL